MGRLTAGYDRLLQRTLTVRPLVLVFGAAVLLAIVVLFAGAKRELAPTEDRGYVFVAAKAAGYANVEYTARFTAEVETIFRSPSGVRQQLVRQRRHEQRFSAA